MRHLNIAKFIKKMLLKIIKTYFFTVSSARGLLALERGPTHACCVISSNPTRPIAHAPLSIAATQQ
jgi:hypothetical protein